MAFWGNNGSHPSLLKLGHLKKGQVLVMAAHRVGQSLQQF